MVKFSAVAIDIKAERQLRHIFQLLIQLLTEYVAIDIKAERQLRQPDPKEFPPSTDPVAIDIKAERQLRPDIEVLISNLNPSRNRHQSRKAITHDGGRAASPFAARIWWGKFQFRRGEDTAPYRFTLVKMDIKAERQLRCGRDGARPSLFAVAMDRVIGAFLSGRLTKGQ